MKKRLKIFLIFTVICIMFSDVLSVPLSAENGQGGEDDASVSELTTDFGDEPLIVNAGEFMAFNIFGYADDGSCGPDESPFGLFVEDESIAYAWYLGDNMVNVQGLSEGKTVLEITVPDGRAVNVDIEVCGTYDYVPVPDYAPILEYDNSPMAVGETREVRVYNPETGKAGELTFNIPENGIFSLTYEKGSSSFYVKALTPGTEIINIIDSTCAFSNSLVLTAEEIPAENDLAPVLEYDDSPMEVGEMRAVRVFNDVTENIGNLSFKTDCPELCTIDYTEGEDVFYITAKKPGTAVIEVISSDCALPGYVTIEFYENHTEPTMNTGAAKAGDLNGDNAVNVADLVKMQQLINTKAAYTVSADMNCDGTVNVFDMILLRRAILGNYSSI